MIWLIENIDSLKFKHKLKKFSDFKSDKLSDNYSLKYIANDFQWFIYLKHKNKGFLDCHLMCEKYLN